ncbi:MAG TPA: vWA domain-containing protein [Chloroflexia bacterium]|nr:vWA domain-containing protein [Chloroflexia bacterium]
MVNFRVTPHPPEAQVLQGQNLARTMYEIAAEQGGGGAEMNVPVFLGVVLDQSGSMEGSKLAAAKEALLRLLHQVPATENVVIHITLFSDEAEEFIRPMTGSELRRDMSNLARRIDNISAGGATSLGSGQRVVLRASRPYSQYERRVLMITDGKQEGTLPVSDAYEAARQLASAGIRVDAWGVGTAWEADQLRTIAHSTGGEADALPDAYELAEAVAELFTEVQSTAASNVQLVLNTPVGTRIRSVRQVYPSVQDRAANQVNEQKWVIPVGSLTQDPPKFVIEMETTPRANDIPFRILVPTVLYHIGDQEYADELDRSAWFFVRWVGNPAQIKMDEHLTRYTGESEIADLSREGFALLEMGAVDEATAKLSAALQKAVQINSPQAVMLSAVVNPQTGKLVSTNASDAINKTGKLRTGKTGKILSGTGKLPGPGGQK